MDKDFEDYINWVVNNIDKDIFIKHFLDFMNLDMLHLLHKIGVKKVSFDSMNVIANAKAICDVGFGDHLLDAIMFSDISEQQRQIIFDYDDKYDVVAPRKAKYYQKINHSLSRLLRSYIRQNNKVPTAEYLAKELGIDLEYVKNWFFWYKQPIE